MFGAPVGDGELASTTRAPTTTVCLLGPVRHHERGRASPNPDAPSSGRASESGTRQNCACRCPLDLLTTRAGPSSLIRTKQVQARLNLVFAKVQGVAKRAERCDGLPCARAGLPLPVRPVLGLRHRTTSSGATLIVHGFAAFFQRSGLCWGLCLRPSAEGREPMPPRFGWGNRQGGNRGLGGLPESFSSSPWLQAGRSSWPISAAWRTTPTAGCSGTHRRAAQRF